MTKSLQMGVIGLGNIGRQHVHNLSHMQRVTLAAVCDIDTGRAQEFAAQTGARAYSSVDAMLQQAKLDAVIVAVPHFDHVTAAIAAFEQGVHVLCEKPLAVHVGDGQKIIAAYETARRHHPNLRFAMMFNERTFPAHKKIKEIVAGGTLGRLVRATWINTRWFRTQAYYDSGSWRATWAGEGGGILTNQCPHNLDMYQWLFGLPTRVQGHAHLGKYHAIEVEDEVTGYFEHEGGMVGHFIVSTAESPGTNRLEIVGELGRLLFEDGALTLQANEVSMITYSQESKDVWGGVKSSSRAIPIEQGDASSHGVVTEQFVAAILDGSPLIAEGVEGLGAVTLANAIMLSSFTGQMVELPLDPKRFEVELQARIDAGKKV
ncbi:MAG: Gfo/Idh/MocA family oxidoreductase [Firmicutes bacterium]|nr:Gfo/Idh/MocA family oxidoreductase [Bacillota bacterium]